MKVSYDSYQFFNMGNFVHQSLKTGHRTLVMKEAILVKLYGYYQLRENRNFMFWQAPPNFQLLKYWKHLFRYGQNAKCKNNCFNQLVIDYQS